MPETPRPQAPDFLPDDAPEILPDSPLDGSLGPLADAASNAILPFNKLLGAYMRLGEAGAKALGEPFLRPIKDEAIEQAAIATLKAENALDDAGLESLQSVTRAVGKATQFGLEMVPESAGGLLLLGAAGALGSAPEKVRTAIQRGIEFSRKAHDVSRPTILATGTGLAIGVEGLPKVQTAAGPLPNPGPMLAQAVAAVDSIAADFRHNIGGIIKDPALVVARQKGEKISDIIVSAIEGGKITPIDGARLLGVEFKLGDDVAILAERFRQARTAGGQILNRLSQAAKAFDDELSGSPELRHLWRDALTRAQSDLTIGDKLLSPLGEASRSLINTWRGLLVTQVGTAARNFVSQTGRVGVGMIDDAINGAMRRLSGAETSKAAFSNVVEDFMSIVRESSPTQRQKLSALLEQFPKAKLQLQHTYLSDVSITGGIVDTLNVLNRSQETFFRRIAFDARLRSNLTRLGIKMDDLPAIMAAGDKTRSAVLSLVDDAVGHALDMTFASPAETNFGKAIMGMYKAAPILNVLGNPFPRFWLNAMRFNAEFSPLGLAFTKTASKNPEIVYRGASRMMTGMGLYSAALAVRASKYAGDKWYEVRPDPDKEPLRVVDTRNFNPFASMLFTADMFMRSLDVSSGKRKELGYSAQDITNAVLALRRSDFSGLAFLDNFVFNKKDLLESGDSMSKNLKKTMGGFIGGFGVPARVVRDALSAIYSDGQQSTKSVEGSPILGPLFESIPGLRDMLPDLPSATRAGPQMREEMGRRQFTGISAKTKTQVEHEIDSLGIHVYDFLPKSGVVEADLAIRAKLGPMVELALGEVVNLDGYKSLDAESRKILLLESLRALREDAVKEVRQQRPDLDISLRILRLPPGPRRDIEELLGDLTPKPKLP